VSVSAATPAPSSAQVAELTVQTTTAAPDLIEPKAAFGLNLTASAALAGLIGVLWVVFR